MNLAPLDRLLLVSARSLPLTGAKRPCVLASRDSMIAVAPGLLMT